MNTLLKYSSLYLCVLAIGWSSSSFGDNQTSNVSPILPVSKLPFRVRLELADFSLPNGVHSGAIGNYKNKWLFLTGRTNGMHGFEEDKNNFPPQQQNTTVYVIDLDTGTVQTRSLEDPKAGLTRRQIDTLSVTSPQFYQSGNTLYITGGYGVDSRTGKFSTKDVLSAIDVSGLIHWVTHPSEEGTAAQYIRQISHPIFQVTGGYMTQIQNNPTLLVFGQNFKGYYHASSNGEYTEQVRRFNIIDDGNLLFVNTKLPKPLGDNPNYRRRDLNVVPVIRKKNGKVISELIAYSGVFTLTDGAWTLPVKIKANGDSFMADPNSPKSFKQGMNNYASAFLGLFSKKCNDMYTIFFGGISLGYFDNGVFKTDDELPFINQITTIRIDNAGRYKQYLMDEEFPVILSTQSNPGNRLLFGAGAEFLPLDGLSMYRNGVLRLDRLTEPTVVGYIVGGIQSTVPNTTSSSDSAASPYIFRVTIIPRSCK